MKFSCLLAGLLVFAFIIGQASSLMVTVVGNSIDTPLVQGYLENFRVEGLGVQTVTAGEFERHKTDPVILILGGQNAPEGVGEIAGGVMNPREKADVLSGRDSKVLVVVPNVWADRQRVMVFAGYGKEQTRSLFAETQGDLLKVLKFNETSMPDNFTTVFSVDVPSLDPSQPFTEVNALQADAIVRQVPDVIVMDVRGAPLYAVGHIPGAINLPEREFEQSLGTLEKDKTYLLYCGGNSQSIRVGNIMSQNGFTRLYRLVDGYMAWRKAGLPKAK